MEKPKQETQTDENSSESSWTGRFVGHLPMCLGKATVVAAAVATGPITATVAVAGVTAHTLYGVCSTGEPQTEDEAPAEAA